MTENDLKGGKDGQEGMSLCMHHPLVFEQKFLKQAIVRHLTRHHTLDSYANVFQVIGEF